MLTKQEYAKIAAKWPLKAYQRWDRLNVRLRFFEQFIPLFKGMDVLEFGCNAGMYGYEVSKVANSYMGVDPSDRYIPQAMVTKKFIKKFNPNVEFYHRRVKGFIRDQQKALERGETVPNFNAMFASFALYHFNDNEIRLIEQYVLPKCELVVIQNRTKKRTNRKKKKIWREHNTHKFYKNSNVVKYLERNGFECEVKWGLDKKFADIIGRKNVDKGRDKDDRETPTESTGGRDSQELGQNGTAEGCTQPGVDQTGPTGSNNTQGPDGGVLQVQPEQGDEGVSTAAGVSDTKQKGGQSGSKKSAKTRGSGNKSQGVKVRQSKTGSTNKRKKKEG